MSINENQLQFIINSDVEQLVSYIQSDYGASLPDAFGAVYNSKIYQKLINTDTGLYLKSPDYIYDYLKSEIHTDKF